MMDKYSDLIIPNCGNAKRKYKFIKLMSYEKKQELSQKIVS